MGQYNDAINTYEHLMSEMKENGNYDVGKNVHVHACMCTCTCTCT